MSIEDISEQENHVSESRASQVRKGMLQDSGDISVLDLLLVLGHNRQSIFRAALALAVVGIIVALFLPNIYVAHSVILTPRQMASVSSMLSGDIGLLSTLGSTGDALGLNDPNEMYITMLTSRTVESSVISRFHLAQVYGTSTETDTLVKFGSNLKVSSGHNGTITLEFTDKDPKRAADVTNALIEELQNLSQQMGVSEASQRRQFFGAQFDKARQELSAAELQLKKAQEGTGMLDLDKQTAAIVQGIAALKGQIMAQEIMIKGLKSYGTSRNPDVIRAQQELTAMRNQLTDLEKRQQGGNGDIYLASSKLPSAGLEYVRRLRDVKYYEAIYEALGRQYEAAVVDESTKGAVVQVIDRASPPDKKSGPHRGLIVLAFFCVGFMVSYCWFLGAEVFQRIENDPEEGPKARALRELVPARISGWAKRSEVILRKVGKTDVEAKA